MSDAKTERARTDAKLNAAVAAAAAPPPMARIDIALPGGRQAAVMFPVPLAPAEAILIATAFSTAYLQALEKEMRQTAGGRIVLPT